MRGLRDALNVADVQNRSLLYASMVVSLLVQSERSDPQASCCLLLCAAVCAVAACTCRLLRISSSSAR